MSLVMITQEALLGKRYSGSTTREALLWKHYLGYTTWDHAVFTGTARSSVRNYPLALAVIRNCNKSIISSLTVGWSFLGSLTINLNDLKSDV